MTLFKRKKKKDRDTGPQTDTEWDDYFSRLSDNERQAAHAVFDDMDKTLADTIATLEQTKGVGAKTLETLDQQTDQLKAIDKGINEIRMHNYQNKRRLNVIRSIFGWIKNKFTNLSCLKPRDNEWEDDDPLPSPSDRTPPPATPVDKDTLKGRLADTGVALDTIDGMTQDLYYMSRQMNRTINTQNANLDRILSNADDAIDGLERNIDRTKTALT